MWQQIRVVNQFGSSKPVTNSIRNYLGGLFLFYFYKKGEEEERDWICLVDVGLGVGLGEVGVEGAAHLRLRLRRHPQDPAELRRPPLRAPRPPRREPPPQRRHLRLHPHAPRRRHLSLSRSPLIAGDGWKGFAAAGEGCGGVWGVYINLSPARRVYQTV